MTLTDADLRNTYNNGSSFSGCYRRLTFYYAAGDPQTSQGTQILVLGKDINSATVGYVPVTLMTMLGMLAIYGFVSCVRCCFHPGYSLGSLVREYEQREWVCSSQERLRLVLERSPKCKFAAGSARFTQRTCTVCLADFGDSCDVRVLVCAHIFHTQCIEAWVAAKINEVPKCPVCNIVLPYGCPAEFKHEDPPGPSA